MRPVAIPRCASATFALDHAEGISLHGVTAGGIWEQAWARLPRALDWRKQIDHEQAIADGTFSSAKKGGECAGKNKRRKGTKIMLLVDATGVPLAANIHSASPNKVTLIEPLHESRLLRRRIKRLICDKQDDRAPFA